MLLTTFIFLSVFFTFLIGGSYFLGPNFRIGVMVGSIGLMILGLTIIADSRGIVIEDGKTVITENKTTGQTTTTEQITYEQISTGMTQFLQYMILLAGLAVFYSGYNLYYKDPKRTFDRDTR